MSIDDDEAHYLKVIMDEIFGRKIMFIEINDSDIHEHLRNRMEQRGISKEEIEKTIR